MITVSGRRFHLRGANYSYVFEADGAGYLLHLYFGRRIADEDISFLAAPCFLSFSPEPPDALSPAFSLGTEPQEYGCYGQGDFRRPALVFVREGGRASNLRYEGYELTSDAVPAGLPHVRGGETLAVKLRDTLADVRVTLFYTVNDDSDVLVRHAEIEAGEDLVLERVFSFSLDLPAGDYDVLRLHGRHLAERIPCRTALGHGLCRIESSRGASSHQMNPFLAVMGRDASEDSGDVYGFGLIYSGSFALEAERCQTDVRVQGGLNDLGFSWRLKKGEVFTAPQAMLAWSSSGMGGLSRVYADFFRTHILPPERVFSPRPIVINNWEATYFDFDTPALLKLIDEAAALGIDTFVLDDGWFGARSDDHRALGDWYVNCEKLAGGLDPVIAHCKERGMKFGLWFEPEMISENSDLFRAHPGWAVGTPPRCKSRDQYVLDLSRPEIVDYIYNCMAKLLQLHDISYVKWDMNRHLTEFCGEKSGGREGEFAHRYMLGVYALAERLAKNFPGVFFEGCSGGGGRFDAGMLYYFPQFWTSDDTDPFERAKIQWGTSYAYPMSAMSCHVSASPNHQTGRETLLSARGHIASLGATGYELDLGKLSAEEKEAVKAQIIAYREVEDLILRGDLYRLSDPFGSNVFAELAVSKDKTRAYAVGMVERFIPSDYNRRLRLKGLDENKRYHVRELGLTLHGSTLMHAGLLLPKLHDLETWVWHIEQV